MLTAAPIKLVDHPCIKHVTPEMTLRYAQIASPTVRAAYDTATGKVRARRPLFVIPAGGRSAVPAKVDWLHAELIKTRLAHGFCSRDPVADACPYSNICEQCDNFVPDPTRVDVIAEQLDDIRHLHDDANARDWTSENRPPPRRHHQPRNPPAKARTDAMTRHHDVTRPQTPVLERLRFARSIDGMARDLAFASCSCPRRAALAGLILLIQASSRHFQCGVRASRRQIIPSLRRPSR